MSNSETLQIALIYTASGKRYTFPQELLEKFVNEETLAKIKVEIIKEIQKLK